MKKLLLVSVLALVAPLAAAAGDAQKGKEAYVTKGCWQCHGYEGQGGAAGPRLANTQMPEAGLTAFVRGTSGAMPPYSDKIVSDAQLSDIFAYLQSRPKPADAATIPLLAQ